MQKERDYQRSKVYNLDDRLQYAAAQKDDYSDLETIYEMQQFVNAVWAACPWANETGASPVVEPGKGCRRALGGRNQIWMPRWARNPVIICHEIAHCYITRVNNKLSPHGKEYMAVYRAFLIAGGILTASEIDTLAVKESVQIDLDFLELQLMEAA